MNLDILLDQPKCVPSTFFYFSDGAIGLPPKNGVQWKLFRENGAAATSCGSWEKYNIKCRRDRLYSSRCNNFDKWRKFVWDKAVSYWTRNAVDSTKHGDQGIAQSSRRHVLDALCGRSVNCRRALDLSYPDDERSKRIAVFNWSSIDGLAWSKQRESVSKH